MRVLIGKVVCLYIAWGIEMKDSIAANSSVESGASPLTYNSSTFTTHLSDRFLVLKHWFTVYSIMKFVDVQIDLITIAVIHV